MTLLNIYNIYILLNLTFYEIECIPLPKSSVRQNCKQCTSPKPVSKTRRTTSLQPSIHKTTKLETSLILVRISSTVDASFLISHISVTKTIIYNLVVYRNIYAPYSYILIYWELLFIWIIINKILNSAINWKNLFRKYWNVFNICIFKSI